MELSQILKQNKDLATELSQCQSKLEQQQVINTSATNDRNDKELEFLLKEKQLNRKLQEARQEIEALRALLEDTPRNTPVHERQTPNEPD